MILTVTPNPALDLTYLLDGLPVGEALHVDAPAVRAGGKGVNVARVAAQTGHAVRALATAGGGAGAEFAAELGASGLPHRLVPVAGETRRSIALVDRAGGTTTVLNEHGSLLAPSEREALLTAVEEELAAGAQVLIASGSLPPGLDAGFYAELVRRARAAGIPAVIDAVGPALLAAVEAGAALVKPNLAELRATTGLSDPVTGARALHEAGARLVVVSLGEDGLLMVPPRGPAIRARLPHALAGNPTGAGDAAVAAFACWFETGHGEGIPAMLAQAVAWSAAAVLAPTAGELHPDFAALEARVALTTEGPR